VPVNQHQTLSDLPLWFYVFVNFAGLFGELWRADAVEGLTVGAILKRIVLRWGASAIFDLCTGMLAVAYAAMMRTCLFFSMPWRKTGTAPGTTPIFLAFLQLVVNPLEQSPVDFPCNGLLAMFKRFIHCCDRFGVKFTARARFGGARKTVDIHPHRAVLT